MNKKNGYSVTFEGFKTQEEAKQFIAWYEGQGEQDIVPWLEARADEGLEVRTFLSVNTGKSGYIYNKGKYKVYIEE